MIYLFPQIKRSQIPEYEVNSDPFLLCEGHNIRCQVGLTNQRISEAKCLSQQFDPKLFS